MRVPRLFHDGSLDTSTVQLNTSAAQHAVQVLRLTTGDEVVLFNGDGHDYQASIAAIKKFRVDVTVHSRVAINIESGLHIELGIALIKNDRLDIAMQKATELGVQTITPINTEFSSIKINADKQDKKYQHWQSVIQHACEQCGRSTLPVLNIISTLDDFIGSDNTKSTLVLNPLVTTSLNDLTGAIKTKRRLRLLIGPEGGFSDKELQLFTNKNLLQLKLGPRILRAETAAISAITLLQSTYGDLA